jgi:hypothetical protein
VENHVSNLLSKLGLERRTQVAVLATRLRGRRADGILPSGGDTTPSQLTPRGDP